MKSVILNLFQNLN